MLATSAAGSAVPIVGYVLATNFLQASVKHHAAPEGGEAMGSVSPVSTTLKCIINLTIQYLVVYTALALMRTYHDLSGTPRGKIEQTLRTAAMTVTFAAPLSVLFIGCRMMRALAHSGHREP